MRKFKLHKSITQDRVVASVQLRMSSLENPGFCIICGEEAMSVDPDQRRGTCESCGLKGVYGDEELLQMIA